MRITILFIALVSSIVARAQMSVPANSSGAGQNGVFDGSNRSVQKHTLSKRWFFTSFSGVGMGFDFFKGGSATVFTAPVGLQLNRRLNDNFFGFASVSLMPAYVNFGHSFLTAPAGKLQPANESRSNSFGLYTRADLGLMYINDARTFSISGSLGVQRATNPLFLYLPVNAAGTNSLIQPNR